MPIAWHRIAITSTQRSELIDVAGAVARACSGAGDGLVVVYCPHTTAGVIVQEAEPGLLHDLETWLARAVPNDGSYRHDRVDDNAASHLRAMVAGASVVAPLRGGLLGLGTWQRILFVELDGPRQRYIEVGVIT